MRSSHLVFVALGATAALLFVLVLSRRDDGARVAAPIERAGSVHAPSSAAARELDEDGRSVPRTRAPADEPSRIEADRAALAVDSGDVAEAPAGRSVALLALDAASGLPLPGFRVRIDADGERALEVVTDEHGRAETEPVLAAGVVDVEHVVEPGHERFGVPWMVDARTHALAGPTGSRTSIELRFRPPLRFVDIDVVSSSGLPRIACEVVVVWGARRSADDVDWSSWRFALTDERGRASFPLYASSIPDEDFRDATFAAMVGEPQDGEVSDTLVLEPPLAEVPHLLTTYPGSELIVTVRDAAGATVEGIEVGAYPAGRLRPRRPDIRTTDASGRARFGPLAAGEQRVWVRSVLSREVVASALVNVRRGEPAVLDVDLAAPQTERVVASGRIVDPDGAPVAGALLSVRLDDAAPINVFPDDDGSFAVASDAPCEWVRINTNGSVFTDPIEPASVRVRAGTTDILLVSHPVGAQVSVVFSLLDAQTRAPIPDALDPAIILYREPPAGDRIVAVARYGPSNGVTEVDFKPHDDLFWVVLVPGYEEARGRIDRSEDEDGKSMIEVALESGFRREFVITDARTDAPIDRAEITSPDGRLRARSSSDGHVVVHGDAWPDGLRIEHPDYAPLDWTPRAYWSDFSGAIRLKPTDPGH